MVNQIKNHKSLFLLKRRISHFQKITSFIILISMLVFAFLQLHFESVLLMQFYHIDMLFGPLYIYPKKKKKKSLKIHMKIQWLFFQR